MEDEIVVVDDEQHNHMNGFHEAPLLSEVAYDHPKTVTSVSLRLNPLNRNTPLVPAPSNRTMRSAYPKAKTQPKLKLKLNEKAGTLASGASFLGAYDRELDSDDEELAFEEQFILRMPVGEDCEKLRKAVGERDIGNDIWFKFKDSRRAVFHIGKNLYSAKLVDLPCIVESQKTLDNKQMFKVADICQMLAVEERIDSEDIVQQQRSFNIDEFIWPHGITPPLHNVRKRRFRKRVNRRTIETVEQEVERLLEADAVASQVQYDVLENVNPDLSDSEFIERENTIEPGTVGSDIGDAPTPLPGALEDEEEDAEIDDVEGEIDEELAAELDLALGDEDGEVDEEDEDDQSDEDEEDDDDDDDDDENVQMKRLLNEEINDLEQAIARKNNEIASSANPLIKRRFEDALKKLQADLDMKVTQRDGLKEQQRLRNAGIESKREDSEQNEEMDVAEEEDLFGDYEMADDRMDTG